MSTRTFANGVRYVKISTIIFLLTLTTSCGPMLGYQLYKWATGSGGSGSGENYSPTTPIIEATRTYSIALGGVAPGRDELILTDAAGVLLDIGSSSLRFEANNSVVGLLPRRGYDDFASGRGAQIVPQKAGSAVIIYYIDDVLQEEQLLVIVPPQSLIQMMVAEASTQLTDEATLTADSHVALTSASPTADAIGAVTRNRVSLIIADDDPSLFEADETTWDSSPPASYYDAVIGANSGGIYQYSPVDPLDPTHETYTNAEARAFLDSSLHRAYDQAVLSAAGIFSGTTTDSTGDAFGFYSPTEDEWLEVYATYGLRLISIPGGCGIADSAFPAFAPIQILILNDIWTYPGARPAFLFVRDRELTEYAIVK